MLLQQNVKEHPVKSLYFLRNIEHEGVYRLGHIDCISFMTVLEDMLVKTPFSVQNDISQKSVMATYAVSIISTA